MENVMDKIFKIVYIGSYATSALFLLFHLLFGLKFLTLLIAFAIITVILFFLGFLIQEHLDHILQLYLIIVGIVTILTLFFKTGTFWDKALLGILGVGYIAISFIFDEFFEASE